MLVPLPAGNDVMMMSLIGPQLVLNLEQELQDFEQASGYSLPVHKPPAGQVVCY